MYADRRETFVNTCTDMVFKFQWHIEKHWFHVLDLGPRLISMSPLTLIICKATQRYSSKFDMIRRCIVVNSRLLLLGYCF